MGLSIATIKFIFYINIFYRKLFCMKKIKIYKFKNKSTEVVI